MPGEKGGEGDKTPVYCSCPVGEEFYFMAHCQNCGLPMVRPGETGIEVLTRNRNNLMSKVLREQSAKKE